jgi:hypothetical protein
MLLELRPIEQASEREFIIVRPNERASKQEIERERERERENLFYARKAQSWSATPMRVYPCVCV